MAAAANVAAQVQKLDHKVDPVWPAAKDRELGFACAQVDGLLRHPAATPSMALAQAQAQIGCFLTIRDQTSHPNAMQIALKDIFRFGTHRPTAGLLHPPKELSLSVSPLIERLRAAGGHIAATTKLSAWCYLPIEHNEQVKPPRNPLGAGLLAGGSSSGSAAAVAIGAVSVALGSDTGGSIRIPAALCGVYGFKPSREAITEHGAVQLGPTQDTIGLLAKSPIDLQSVYRVLTSIPAKAESGATNPIFGIPDGIFDKADARMQEGLQTLITHLSTFSFESRPTLALDLDRMNAIAGLITGYEAAGFHGPRMTKWPKDYPSSIRNRLTIGLAISDATYRTAQSNRMACTQWITKTIFSECDYILTPVLNQHRQKVLDSGPNPDLQHIGKLSLEVLSMNRWVNLLGLPSISIPVACNDSVPAAVQIVGTPRSDHELLSLACDIGNLCP